MRFRTLLTVLLATCATVTNAWAADYDPIRLAEESERLYADGLAKLETAPDEARSLFRASAESLNRLRRDHGTGADIEYNLGNALVQSGDLGRGIAAYLRAERMSPTDPRIAANLAHARGLVSRPITGDAVRPAWASVGHWWTPIPNRFAIFAVAWSLAWIGLAILVVARDREAGWRNPLRNASLGLLAVGLAAGATVALDLAERHFRRLGVTVADGIVVRKGNGEGFAPQIAERLVPGVEFRLLERRPGWIRVRLPDATEGWIREEQAEEA